MPQIGQCPYNAIVAPGAILLRAMRTTNASNSGSMVGRPGALRCVEPSNFCATRLRCQPRIVSGLTILATSARAFFPSLWPMSQGHSVFGKWLHIKPKTS